MNRPTYGFAGTLATPHATPVPSVRQALKRLWGVACGTAFIAARASIYLVVLPLTAIAALTGVALYGVQALLGVHRG